MREKPDTRKKGLGRPRSGRVPSKQELFRLYISEGKSIRKIGETLNCTKDMVARALKAYGIEAKPKVRRSSLERLDIEELKALSRAKGVRGTAKELGMNPSTLSRLLRVHQGK